MFATYPSFLLPREEEEMSTCLRLSSVCLWKNTYSTTTTQLEIFFFFFARLCPDSRGVLLPRPSLAILPQLKCVTWSLVNGLANGLFSV